MGSGLLTGFLALMVSGVPVAMAMAVASLVYVMISGTIPDFVVIHRMYGGVDSFPLLAVPFFIWAGNLMNSAGITNRIYNFALALVGWLKGGSRCGWTQVITLSWGVSPSQGLPLAPRVAAVPGRPDRLSSARPA